MFYTPVSASICKKFYYANCGSQMHFNCLFCQVCGTLYAYMLAKEHNWGGGGNFAICHIIVIFLIKTVM